MNPNDVSNVGLSNNNLIVTSIASGWQGVRSNLPINNIGKDKIYLEIEVESCNNNNSMICLINKSQSLTDYNAPNRYWSDGTSYGKKWNIGDVISVLYDNTLDNGTLVFWNNGEPQGVRSKNLNEQDLYLAFLVFKSSTAEQILTVNFGKGNFKYKIPNGYDSL
ncbi:hypothetical protein KQI86_03870 [Clostridium sp. MSJ-11]|uniref:SPRY domain-containing protein n=1 Tax=Clostridium mobile TaxID=2841512 RepID=A0ABS6EE21_9CLOT|nr:SPRY domain-containing protein [Clostridium mobile]MBU5483453.1 hypothetical protein [Clostridium mobile]